MNRQCSSNSSSNLINWDDQIEEPRLVKCNSLVEMFDPIFDNSYKRSSDTNNADFNLQNSTSSEDIFGPPLDNNKLYPTLSNHDDFFSDLETNSSERTSSIYPSLNSFKSILTDERYSIFETSNADIPVKNTESYDLRPSIFKSVDVEKQSQSLFNDGYADQDMERYMKVLTDYHMQSLCLRDNERTNLVFNRVLPERFGEVQNQSTNKCMIIIKISLPNSFNDELFTSTVEPYSINERELMLDVTEKYSLTQDFNKLYFRISGQSEYFRQGEFPLICYSHVFESYRIQAPVKLILEYIDINIQKYKSDHIEDISQFVYCSLEKNFHWFLRGQIENSYESITSYRNQIVSTLKKYNTEDMDLQSIDASIDVFKNKCLSICILCDNVYTYNISEIFLEIDVSSENLMTKFSYSDKRSISAMVKSLINVIDKALKAILKLIYNYTVLCNTSFSIRSEKLSAVGLYSSISGSQSIRKCRTTLEVKVGAVCRIPTEFANNNSFEIKLCLRVGKLRLSEYLSSKRKRITDSCTTNSSPLQRLHENFDQCIPFSQRLCFDNVIMYQLPLDVSLRVYLIGRKITNTGDTNYISKEVVGWGELALFDSRGFLRQGSMFLGLFRGTQSPTHWSCGMNRYKNCMIVEIDLPTFHMPVKYLFEASNANLDMDISSPGLIQSRKHEIEQNILSVWLQQYRDDKKSANNDATIRKSCERSQFLWHNRHLLLEQPSWYMGFCLSLTVHSGSLDRKMSASQLYGAEFEVGNSGVDNQDSRDWLFDYLELCRRDVSSPSALAALVQMLGPLMPLSRLRKWAIQGLLAAGPDSCLSMLPWLVEALKYDMNLGSSGLEALLLEFSLKNINFATSLFWNLSSVGADEVHGYRVTLLLAMLQVVMNNAVKKMWNLQLTIVEHLQRTATTVKIFKGSVADRKSTMMKNLEELYDLIFEGNLEINTINDHPLCNYRIPYQPGFQLTKLEMKDCSYFNSFTLPLRIVFRGLDGENVELMFKHGDDLRQDILVLQILRLMDEIWSSNGLDLHTVHYRVMPTGHVSGLIELVPDCSTLRKIQEMRGGIAAPLTSADVIADWLKGHSASRATYQQNILNFLLTSVASCVATFLLGIGDRHNDNIMIQTNGRLFHIDFAKILGDAQTFAGIKRDRVPFVLTQDMVYVLEDLQPTNGIVDGLSRRTSTHSPELNSNDRRTGMQLFIDKCCEAYNIIRHHWSSVLSVLAIAADSGIPGVNHKTILYVVDKMRLELSDIQASEYFTDLIRKCVSSISTPMNFVIHNLAQMKYSSNNEGNLFSFTPKIYSNDPKIVDISIKSVKRMRQPNKHYVFQIQVKRETLPKISMIYRRYEHFCELAQHLSSLFPLSSLPKFCQHLINIGSPNSLTAAESKRAILQQFITEILEQQEEISHCQEVQTFCHSILSDEQTDDDELNTYQPQLERSVTKVSCQPEIQLKIHFDLHNLEIFVKHARNLSCGRNLEPPNAYVKTYLHPNPGFNTKRKTGVIPRNNCPSFNDIIQYEHHQLIHVTTLEVAVWHNETFGENVCLGTIMVPINNEQQSLLSEDKEKWYKLQPNQTVANYDNNIMPFNPRDTIGRTRRSSSSNNPEGFC